MSKRGVRELWLLPVGLGAAAGRAVDVAGAVRIGVAVDRYLRGGEEIAVQVAAEAGVRFRAGRLSSVRPTVVGDSPFVKPVKCLWPNCGSAGHLAGFVRLRSAVSPELQDALVLHA